MRTDDEAPIELPAGPTVMEIRDCDDCPFSRFEEMGVGCVLVPNATCYRYSDEPIAKLPPSWCPLDKGPVLVQVRK
jgi:hypothetical protein